MKPVISIIVPVYNVEPFIEDCLNSILAQSFSNLEVILVNDGSTDKSGDICHEYEKLDRRVKVINQEYGGVSAARNAGVKVAQGVFIGFVDGDDRIDKDMYTKLYCLCEETNSDISICKLGREINGELINEEEEVFIKEMDNTEAMRELFKGDLYRFSLCNKLFKRKCFENIQFPEGRIHEDLSTTYRLIANADKAVYTNYIGYIYVKRENSILTSKFNQKRLDAFIGWDEILLFMNEKYPKLSKEYISCFVYGCVDNIYYILNQVTDKEASRKYLKKIQQSAMTYQRAIIKNEILSKKYKYIMTLLYYNVGLLLLSNNIKRYL
ncbi:glycosyltransferase [Neobacillus novalis]|uniref:Glycosyltransferase n=1 Tax=Neobacillus novalis TaxID=220687 RepID=A0AA95MJT7_9BACI|nr:glycosyltransferase [Neobacillus novalis]WHY85192.1 glycosyltransferase [Neobacillus novalis]